jgi:uncharacterized protein (DUF1778 family)
MFGKNLKVSKLVLEKLALAASIAGCSSVDEFAERALLNEAERVIASTAKREASAAEVEEITNQLKGLGYLE